MTDNEIIKALDDRMHCGKWIGRGYLDKKDFLLLKNSRDLIKRQQAEIERLRENQIIHVDISERFKKECEYEIKTAKSEAIKEFAERLKKRLDRKYTIYGREYVLRHMRELITEMTEKA